MTTSSEKTQTQWTQEFMKFLCEIDTNISMTDNPDKNYVKNKICEYLQKKQLQNSDSILNQETLTDTQFKK